MLSRHAFTMLELVFVVAIIGILSVEVIGRFDRDTLFEMSEQVLNHIRYTQHMAMHDDSYDHSAQRWYQAYWQMNFVNTAKCGLFYRIGSDRDLDSLTGDFEAAEAARDAMSGDAIYNNALVCEERIGWHPGVLLGEQYDIVSMQSSCGSQLIAFDHQGRPHTGVAGGRATALLLKVPCDYTFIDGSGRQVRITILPETGYAFITYL